MKKLICAAIATAFVAAPAFAAKITLSFAGDDGTTQEWTFDSETNMATTGELSMPYTWDEESATLCADVPDQGEICATFSEVAQAVGESSPYTLSIGGGGTATITAMSE